KHRQQDRISRDKHEEERRRRMEEEKERLRRIKEEEKRVLQARRQQIEKERAQRREERRKRAEMRESRAGQGGISAMVLPSTLQSVDGGSSSIFSTEGTNNSTGITTEISPQQQSQSPEQQQLIPTGDSRHTTNTLQIDCLETLEAREAADILKEVLLGTTKPTPCPLTLPTPANNCATDGNNYNSNEYNSSHCFSSGAREPYLAMSSPRGMHDVITYSTQTPFYSTKGDYDIINYDSQLSPELRQRSSSNPGVESYEQQQQLEAQPQAQIHPQPQQPQPYQIEKQEYVFVPAATTAPKRGHKRDAPTAPDIFIFNNSYSLPSSPNNHNNSTASPSNSALPSPLIPPLSAEPPQLPTSRQSHVHHRNSSLPAAASASKKPRKPRKNNSNFTNNNNPSDHESSASLHPHVAVEIQQKMRELREKVAGSPRNSAMGKVLPGPGLLKWNTKHSTGRPRQHHPKLSTKIATDVAASGSGASPPSTQLSLEHSDPLPASHFSASSSIAQVDDLAISRLHMNNNSLPSAALGSTTSDPFQLEEDVLDSGYSGFLSDEMELELQLAGQHQLSPTHHLLPYYHLPDHLDEQDLNFIARGHNEDPKEEQPPQPRQQQQIQRQQDGLLKREMSEMVDHDMQRKEKDGPESGGDVEEDEEAEETMKPPMPKLFLGEPPPGALRVVCSARKTTRIKEDMDVEDDEDDEEGSMKAPIPKLFLGAPPPGTIPTEATSSSSALSVTPPHNSPNS
ncbi:Myosin X, like 1, partial [Balamuthia mandrillaris]